MLKRVVICLICSTLLFFLSMCGKTNVAVSDNSQKVDVVDNSSYNLWNRIKVWSVNNNLDKDNIQKFFDGEIDSINLPPKTRITIGFEGELELEKISMSFLKENIPSNFKIYSTDSSGNINYSTLFESTQNTNEIIDAKFDKVDAAYISIEFLDEEKTCELNDFKIYGKPTYEEYFNQDTETVLSEKDEKNPLSVWRVPIKKDIYLLAQDILKGKDDLTNHEKIALFMDYTKKFKIGTNLPKPENVVKDKIGECGGFANTVAALAATQGIETRILTLGNYPINDGHVVIECKINNKWSVYDPTYGSYYTTTPENNKNPYVLSFDELKSGRGNNSDIKKNVGIPERLISKASYDFLGPEIYELANPSGVVSPLNKMYYPLSIDYNKDKEITSNEFGGAYQGISYIGAASMNNSHKWTIIGLKENKEYSFKIDGTFVGGEAQADGILDSNFNAYAAIENGTIISGENFTFNIKQNKKEWVIKFKPQSDTVKITLSHNYVGPEFHYVSLDKFTVE